MSIKTKVALGVALLFTMIIVVSAVGIYYLNDLAGDSQNILKNNYETLEYTKRITRNIDSLQVDSATAMTRIETNLRRQEQNVTEAGEREATSALRVQVERLKNAGLADSTIVQVRTLCLAIQDMNMQAIVRKNSALQDSAGSASTYLIVIGTVCTLIAFTFIINFPGYIADPIAQLTRSIQSIANKDYEERLHFDRNDEFETLGTAFNQMVEKLDEYEHSNLAKILFEKKRIEAIINRMTDPVIGLDERDRVIFANDEALRLLHLRQTDVIDHYAPDLAVNNDLFRSLIRQPQNKGEASTLIRSVVDGKENFFSREATIIHYTPTGESDTIKVGQVILLKNVTSYKELDLAKTNFIATISHELKTPIASIQMCVRLMRDTRVGTLNEEQQNIISTLNDEITRLSRITGELLDLSQVETGNIKLDIRRTDPKDIVPLALEAVRFQAERKHVILQTHIDSNIPPIQADLDKTTWVLVNLLTNAIRYSPENGTVYIQCHHIDNSIQFVVKDQGPGIDKKYLGRLFEKFYQVPGTPSGSGLGLAISKEFIEAQQGTITVASELGQGSAFSFSLPAVYS
jgi:two-component system, NtrC family, sensor histidine kinase KinB